MSKKIEFGNDLVKELKKYGLNEIGEVPTKYKNGITTIYYMWSVVSNIDKLGYKTPYIEYTTDEETDGFIMGTMFPQGGDGLGIQFDTFEDVKYFINNAEYSNADLTESKKLIKEGTDLKYILSIINDLDDDKLPSAMTFNYLSKWIKEYAKIYNLSIPKFDDYKYWTGKEWKIYFNMISNMPKSRKSIKEGKGVKKSVDIIRHKLMELINDDTIQEEFTEVFDLGTSFDTVDDLFETSVHNILHELLEEHTVEVIPF